MTSGATQWIIDCDPGCDDAIALALAVQHLPEDVDVEVLAVSGNVGVDLTTWNARRVLAACGSDWRVYRGCGESFSGEAVPAASVHGRDGLGDIPNNAFEIKLAAEESESAVRRYIQLVENEKRFVLVCAGPLTNLASALNLMSAEKQARFWRQCDLCVVMGGAFESRGNITASAEFNAYFDPVSVHLVLESWQRTESLRAASGRAKPEVSPIHFVPLDITEQVGVPLHDAAKEKKKANSSQGAGFLLPALRKYGLFHAQHCERPRDGNRRIAFGIKKADERKYLNARVVGENGLKYLGAFCYLHDPLAMWMALRHRENDTRFKEWWSEAYVSMDISDGSARGRLVLHANKGEGAVPNRAAILGTRVLWLDPQRFDYGLRKEFVSCIKKLLGL